jgi:hypothetical protein
MTGCSFGAVSGARPAAFTGRADDGLSLASSDETDAT